MCASICMNVICSLKKIKWSSPKGACRVNKFFLKKWILAHSVLDVFVRYVCGYCIYLSLGMAHWDKIQKKCDFQEATEINIFGNFSSLRKCPYRVAAFELLSKNINFKWLPENNIF